MKRFYKFLMPLVAIVALALPASIVAQTTCQIKIVGQDAYADGWNGGSLAVMQGGTTVATFNAAGADNDGEGPELDSTLVTVSDGPISFVWTSGTYDDEVSIWIYSSNGTLLFQVEYPTAGTIFSMANACSNCVAPAGLNVDSLTTDYARVVWSGDADGYGIVYGESADVANDNGTETSTTDNYFEMTNLTSGTGYTVMIWSECDGGETSDTAVYTFNTVGDPVTVFPYLTGFEEGEDGAWSFVNDATNKWYIGTGAARSGVRGLYISDNNGTTAGYNTSGVQFSYAYRIFTLPETGLYSVGFDWKANGEGSYDYLRAWLAPAQDDTMLTAGHDPVGGTDSYSYTTATPTGWVDLGGKMNLQTTWQSVHATPELAGGSYMFVFMWANDGSGGTNPGACVDNIQLSQLTCPAPENLAVNVNETDGYAEVTWVDSLGTAWELFYGSTGSTPTSESDIESVSTTSYQIQLSDLEQGFYDVYVRTACGSDDNSFWIGPVTFSNGVLVMNMSATGSDTIHSCAATIYDNGGPSGNYSANCQSTLVIYPGNPGDYVVVSGNSYTEGSFDYLTIYSGVGTTGEVLWTDNGVTAHQNFGPFTSEEITVVFHSDGSVNYDGFEINVSCVAPSDCQRPATFDAVSVTPDSIYFEWVDSIGSNWAIAYGPAGTPLSSQNITYVDFSDTEGAIGNLTPNTLYDFYLMTICGNGEGDTSWTRDLTIRTACNYIDSLPWTQNFESAPTGSSNNATFVECMNRLNNGTSYFGYPYVSSSSDYNHTPGGSKGLYWYNTTTLNTYGDYQIIVMPGIDFDYFAINELQLKFWARSSSTSYSPVFQVGVMTNPLDANTFTQLGTVNVGNNTEWTEYTTALGTYEGTGHYIAIRALRPSSSWYAYVDDITIERVPNCPPVVDLTLGGTTTQGAYLHWNYMEGVLEDAPDSYELELYEVGTNNQPVTFTTNEPNIAINGLTASTDYKLYVRVDCGDGLGAPDSISFSTLGFGCAEIDTAQSFIDTIIDGTVTNTYIPSYSTYEYSLTQQIFTAAEIGHGGGITSIYFKPSAYSVARDLEIYLGHIPEATASSFVFPSDLTLVYTGSSVSLTANQFNEFQLSTTFAYNGTDNLLVMVRDMTGSWSGGNTWLGANGASGVSRYIYQDGTPYAIGSTTGGTASSFRSSIIIAGAPCATTATCAAPYVYVTDNDATSASIAWVAGANETSWNVEYRVYGDSVWTTVANGVTVTNYTIANLNPASDYEVRVVTVCSEGEYAGVARFTTECAPSNLPITEDFQNSPYGVFARNCWLIGSTNLGTSYPQPYVISLQGDTDNKLCLFYNGGYMVMNQVSVPLNQLQIRFTLVQGGDNVHFLMGLLEHQTDPISSLIVLDTIVRSEIDTTSAYALYTYNFDNIDPQYNNYYIALWDAFNENYTFVDDLVLDYIPSCAPVTGVTVSNATNTGADVSWTPATAAIGYVVEYGPRNFALGTGTRVTTAASGVNLTGLTHSTNYDVYVYTVCSATDTSDASYVAQFSTACDVVSTLPYTMDFENIMPNGSSATDIMPNCWNSFAISGTQPHILWGSSNIYYQSPTHSLYFYNEGIAVLPEMTAPINTLMVSFFDYNPNADGLIIGAFDNADSSFTPIDTIVYDGSTSAYQVLSFLGNYTGSANRIAFKNFSNSGNTYSTHYIDDVVVDLLPTCTPVRNLHVFSSTNSTVTLDWGSYNGTDDNWIVSYSTTPLTDPMQGTTMAVTAHPYTVTGLTPGTDYYFYVRNDCGAGDSSMWRMVGPTRPGVWIMRPNMTDTVYMCGGTIYDDGGPTGDYSMSQNSYIILMPDAPNNLVSIDGTAYIEGNSYDNLYIYDGVGTTGTQLVALTGTSFSSGTTVSATSTSGALTIYFKSDGSVAYSGFELNVSCISTTCMVTMLRRDTNYAESANSLALTWDAVTDATTYEVEYGQPGFALGTGTTLSTTTNSIVINGLEGLSNYEVYVRSLCSGSDTGSWAHAVFQTAMCDNVIIAQNFIDSIAGTTSTYSPMGTSFYKYGYNQIIIDSAYLSEIVGDINAFAFSPASSSQGDRYNHMTVYLANISPDLDLSSTFIHPSTDVVFDTVISDRNMCYNSNGWQLHGFDHPFTWDGHSNILISIQRDHGSYESGASFNAHTQPAGKGRYVYADGSAYNPSTVSGGTATTTVGDIRLFSCGAGCAKPGIMPTTNVTYNGATINWNSNATDFEVSVKSTNEAVWPAETPATGNSYNVTGLAPATQYQFRVRAICDATENLISDWAMGTFTTDSLPCFEPSNIHTEDIGYTTATLAWTAAEGQNQWSIHIWNSIVDTDYVANANPYTVVGLRDSTRYFATVKAICGNGATESGYSDTVEFTTGTCAQVTGVNVTNLQAHSATINWSSLGVDTYEIEYGNQNFSQGMGQTVVVEGGNTSYNLTGLTDDHTYSVFVRAKCEDNVYGKWSTKVDFTTPEETGITTADGTNLSIFPNPTSNVTTVSVNGVNGEVSITIVDMNGRTVMSDSMECEGGCTKSIEVSGLAQGAYFVRVSGDNLNMVKKLIVK